MRECICIGMYLFRHHKKMFKIQIKRMATIRYYIIKQLSKREA